MIDGGLPSSPPALEAVRVSKRYGPVMAVDEVSLAAPRGMTVVLVGASGSGKSTLLRMFNRMVEPSAGTVLVAGQDATQVDPIALRRRIGYVQQEGGLLPHWTVRANVELVPRLLGWDPERCRRRGEEMLEAVHLPAGRYGERHPAELSGGERQRVAIARALAGDPAVVLLDEPLGALDALTRLALQTLLEELKVELGKTLLMVTHDLAEALRLGDTVGVMHGGRLLQVGSPAELLAAPAPGYVADLLGLLERAGTLGEAGG